MTVLMNRATVAVVCRLTVVVAFALSFALSLALAPAARAQQPAEVYTILVMGDSLSAEYGLRRDTGWIKLLERDLNQPANKLNRRIEIFNASISGETTSGGAHRLPEQLSLHHPDLVIIELGANDALRGLAIQATQDNLRNMVKQSQANPAQLRSRLHAEVQATISRCGDRNWQLRSTVLFGGNCGTTGHVSSRRIAPCRSGTTPLDANR